MRKFAPFALILVVLLWGSFILKTADGQTAGNRGVYITGGDPNSAVTVSCTNCGASSINTVTVSGVTSTVTVTCTNCSGQQASSVSATVTNPSLTVLVNDGSHSLTLEQANNDGEAGTEWSVPSEAYGMVWSSGTSSWFRMRGEPATGVSVSVMGTTPVTATVGTISGITNPISATVGTIAGITNPISATVGTIAGITNPHPVTSGATFTITGMPTTTVTGTISGVTNPVTVSGTVTATVGTITGITNPITAAVGTIAGITNPITTIATGTFSGITNPITATVGTIAGITNPINVTTVSNASISVFPTLTKGTQGTTGVNVQELKDSGRVAIAFLIDRVAGASSETAMTFTVNKVASQSSGTFYSVTAGKTLRLQSIATTLTPTGATAVNGRIRVRISSGSVTTTSPIFINADHTAPTGTNASGTGSTISQSFPDGIEVAASSQLNITDNISSTGSLISVLLSGFEY